MKDNLDSDELSNKAFLAPGKDWAGKELRKYSMGDKVLINHIIPNDATDLFIVWVVLWVLSTDRKVATKLAYRSREDALAEILEWSDKFSDSDEEEAIKLVKEIYAEHNRTKVAVIRDGPASEDLSGK